MLKIVNKKQRNIFILGSITAIIGFLTFISAQLLNLYIQSNIPTMNSEKSDFDVFFINCRLFYFLLITGSILFLIGWVLILYSKHPYYKNKWYRFKTVK